VRPGERRQRSGDSYDLVWIDHHIQILVPWAVVAPRMARQRPRRLIIRLIIQTIRRDPSGSVWTDEASNVSRPDRSGADQIDADHQATDLAVGGSNPSRRAHHCSSAALWQGRSPVSLLGHGHGQCNSPHRRSRTRRLVECGRTRQRGLSRRATPAGAANSPRTRWPDRAGAAGVRAPACRGIREPARRTTAPARGP
jgi:hypothetical protein